MLDTLRHDQFLPFLQQECVLIASDNTVLSVVLASVKEVPAASTGSAPGRRMPFNLVFQGAVDIRHGDGIYTLRVGATDIPGVFLSRIKHIGPTPASCFQAVFT